MKLGSASWSVLSQLKTRFEKPTIEPLVLNTGVRSRLAVRLGQSAGITGTPRFRGTFQHGDMFSEQIEQL
jgi:hypothetical protein